MIKRFIFLFIFVLIGLFAYLAWGRTRETTKTNDSRVSSSQSGRSQEETSKITTSDLIPNQEIVTENYSVQRGDISLYGVITAPRNYREKASPTLIIAHGFNNTLEVYDQYAEDLARQGFLVYRFDFFGGSSASKSGGQDMLDMSVLTEEQDLEAVVASLSQEDFVNDQEIHLLGFSQGGVVSTLYAAENPDKVKSLALVFPAFVLFDDIKETYAQLHVESSDQIPEVITHRNARLGGRYLKDALPIDIWAKIRSISAPVLIVHGTEDEVVPYRYAQEAEQTFPKAKLVTVEGGSHWTSDALNQIALPAIEEFLTK